MNFAQLLAMLRGASTPEARQAIFNGFTSDQRREAVDLLNTRVQELNAKQDRSDEETAEFKLCAEAGVELGKRVKEELDLANAAAQLNSIATTPDGRLNGMFNRHAGQRGNSGTPATPNGAQANQTFGTSTFRQEEFNDDFGRSLLSDIEALGVRNDQHIQAYASEEYHNAFLQYIRSMRSTGSVGGGMFQRALNEGTIESGGATVPPQMLREIIQRANSSRRVASLVRQINASSSQVNIPKFLGGNSKQKNDLAVQWVSEDGPVSEDRSLENWGLVKIDVHRGGFVVVISRSLLEDSVFDLESWIIEQIGDVYAQVRDNIILQGTGAGQPFGIASRFSGSQAIATYKVGADIDFDKLIALVGDLEEPYAENATWVMQRATMYGKILNDRDAGGAFLAGTINTTAGGATARVDDKLLGFPVVLSENATPAGSSAKSVLFGDFKRAYTLVERVALQIEPYHSSTIQLRDQVGFYVRFRMGGDVVQEYALRGGVQENA